MQEFNPSPEQRKLIISIIELMRKTNSFPEIRDCDESIVDYALKELQGKLFSTALIGEETDVLCFKCGSRYGTDCPGRKPDESTLCKPCLLLQDAKENYEQVKHLFQCLSDGMFDEEKFYHFMSQL